MVAGSGTSEDADEKANAPGVVEVDVQKSAAEHEGIPGPITRLFVIANRGVANLVQDLILVRICFHNPFFLFNIPIKINSTISSQYSDNKSLIKPSELGCYLL